MKYACVFLLIASLALCARAQLTEDNFNATEPAMYSILTAYAPILTSRNCSAFVTEDCTGEYFPDVRAVVGCIFRHILFPGVMRTMSCVEHQLFGATSGWGDGVGSEIMYFLQTTNLTFAAGLNASDPGFMDSDTSLTLGEQQFMGKAAANLDAALNLSMLMGYIAQLHSALAARAELALRCHTGSIQCNAGITDLYAAGCCPYTTLPPAALYVSGSNFGF